MMPTAPLLLRTTTWRPSSSFPPAVLGPDELRLQHRVGPVHSHAPFHPLQRCAISQRHKRNELLTITVRPRFVLFACSRCVLHSSPPSVACAHYRDPAPAVLDVLLG